MIPEEGKTNKVSPIVPDLTTWREPSGCSTEGGTQTKLSSLPELLRQSSELGEAKATKIYRTE